MQTAIIESKKCFTPFKMDVKHMDIPAKFTFPFYYEPHPLSVIAANELQAFIQEQVHWAHKFGANPNETDVNSGKMFGVLVVQNTAGELGYLSAFSGKLHETDKPQGFVPHIYDLLPGNNFFEVGMAEINDITVRITELENASDFNSLNKRLENEKSQSQKELFAQKENMRLAKIERKEKRNQAQKELSTKDVELLKTSLVQESLQKKFYYKHLSNHWKEKIQNTENELQNFHAEYLRLKQLRKSNSAALQQQLFDHYQFLNQSGEVQNLSEIFKTAGHHLPPAGAGDCAAPKLLQYAFKNNMKPIAMAEFWWGESPKSAIRKHQQFYPACTGKCQPILGHMLDGMAVDPNPMKSNIGAGLTLQTVFEDEHFMVIHKPSGLLSVPGKNVQDSVAFRLKQKFPDATGPLIVHRLDQPTSGLMLIAKSLEIHKTLQLQFLQRTIKKRYVALLDGEISSTNGTIDLPLRVDINNRPFQLVCYEHGKSARTHYKVLDVKEGKTRIHFFPVTGRTHQLRMHAAHKLGLNTAIVGDALYGTKSNRLHLHAEFIGFHHPISKEWMELEFAPEF